MPIPEVSGTTPSEDMNIEYHAGVRDLALRLHEKGFDWPFVQDYVFPEWWKDELAEIEANRALAEAYIYRALGFSMEELRDPKASLTCKPVEEMRFKSRKNRVDEKILLAASVALQAAEIVVRRVDSNIATYLPGQYPTSQEVRDAILQEGALPCLDTLLRFCWSCGIVVVPLKSVPSAGGSFDGLASWVNDRPVIVLASGRDGEPWLAFHLAHELGHIILGHVGPDKGPLIDIDLEKTDSSGQGDSSDQESEADHFAQEVLTGGQDLNFGKISATELVRMAKSDGIERKIDPGAFCLRYAWTHQDWPTAGEALGMLRLTYGASKTVTYYLDHYLGGQEDLLESEERFLGVLRAA